MTTHLPALTHHALLFRNDCTHLGQELVTAVIKAIPNKGAGRPSLTLIDQVIKACQAHAADPLTLPQPADARTILIIAQSIELQAEKAPEATVDAEEAAIVEEVRLNVTAALGDLIEKGKLAETLRALIEQTIERVRVQNASTRNEPPLPRDVLVTQSIKIVSAKIRELTVPQAPITFREAQTILESGKIEEALEAFQRLHAQQLTAGRISEAEKTKARVDNLKIAVEIYKGNIKMVIEKHQIPRLYKAAVELMKAGLYEAVESLMLIVRSKTASDFQALGSSLANELRTRTLLPTRDEAAHYQPRPGFDAVSHDDTRHTKSHYDHLAVTPLEPEPDLVEDAVEEPHEEPAAAPTPTPPPTKTPQPKRVEAAPELLPEEQLRVDMIGFLGEPERRESQRIVKRRDPSPTKLDKPAAEKAARKIASFQDSPALEAIRGTIHRGDLVQMLARLRSDIEASSTFNAKLANQLFDLLTPECD